VSLKLTTIYRSLVENREVIGEEYPSGWNVEEFEKIRGFAARKRYCDTHLTYLGMGSSRLGYKIDDEKVLKLARNEKGLAQNNAEIELSDDYHYSHLRTKVYNHHPDDLWIEAQFAEKCTAAKFKSILGYSFKDYSHMLEYFYYTILKPSRYFRPDPINNEVEREKITESEFYNDMCSYMHDADMPVGDISAMRTYGIVSDNGDSSVVLIDYGLTHDILIQHYMPKSRY
jgi:hypothetical protein